MLQNSVILVLSDLIFNVWCYFVKNCRWVRTPNVHNFLKEWQCAPSCHSILKVIFSLLILVHIIQIYSTGTSYKSEIDRVFFLPHIIFFVIYCHSLAMFCIQEIFLLLHLLLPSLTPVPAFVSPDFLKQTSLCILDSEAL